MSKLAACSRKHTPLTSTKSLCRSMLASKPWTRCQMTSLNQHLLHLQSPQAGSRTSSQYHYMENGWLCGMTLICGLTHGGYND
jgi:hypothetical protein